MTREALFAVLERLSADPDFLASVARDPAAGLSPYDLTPEEQIAVVGYVRDVLSARAAPPAAGAASAADLAALQSELAAQREAFSAALVELEIEQHRLRARLRALESLEDEARRLADRLDRLERRLEAIRTLPADLAALQDVIRRLQERLRALE